MIGQRKKDSLELLSSAQSTPQYNNQDYLKRAIERINSIPSDRKGTQIIRIGQFPTIKKPSNSYLPNGPITLEGDTKVRAQIFY